MDGVDGWTSPFEKREFEILKIVGILFVCGVILLWIPRGVLDTIITLDIRIEVAWLPSV